MLMNTWQFHLSIGKGWIPCEPSPFLLLTQDYLSEHSHSQISFILNIVWILPSYLYFPFHLYGWSNSNAPSSMHQMHLTISGDIYWEARRGDLGTLNYWWDLDWSGAPETPLCTMALVNLLSKRYFMN